MRERASETSKRQHEVSTERFSSIQAKRANGSLRKQIDNHHLSAADSQGLRATTNPLVRSSVASVLCQNARCFEPKMRPLCDDDSCFEQDQQRFVPERSRPFEDSLAPLASKLANSVSVHRSLALISRPAQSVYPRATTTASPRFPVLPSTLILSFRYFSSSATSKSWSPMGSAASSDSLMGCGFFPFWPGTRLTTFFC